MSMHYTKKLVLLINVLVLSVLSIDAFAQAPSISSHPSHDTACQGGAGYFLVTASNTTSYQWQVNTGSSWSNLSNGGVYGGVTTDSLYITAPTIAMDGYQYRCIATGSTSPAATSNAATLYVSGITATTNDTVCAGQNGQLTATATSSTSLINWYTASSGGTLVDTGSTLTINAASATTTYYAETQGPGSGSSGGDSLATSYNQNNGQRGAMFDVVAGSSPITVTGFDANLYTGTTAYYELYYRQSTHVGYQNSSTGWIFLDSAYNVTSLGNNVPTPLPFTFSVTIPANTRYSFYITNSFGGGLLYTDGTAVGNTLASNSDATIYEGVGKSYPFGLTFTVRNVNATMHYTLGSPSCNSASRVAATLTVNPQSNITSNPSNSSISSGANTSFSISATGATSYQWQLSTNSGSTWTNITNTGVYSNATTTTLGLTSVTGSYNGYQYRCIASNASGCDDTSTAATLSVSGTSPSISAHPSDSTICSGNNASFAVAASGTSLTYQWQVSTNSGSTWSNLSNTGIYSGATSATLSLTAATTSYNSYQYRCVVSGSVSPSATSNAATLTIDSSFTAALINDYPEICLGSDTSFTAYATGSSNYTYQWYVSTNYGSSFSSISNGGIYSGATSSTLTLTSPPASAHAYYYYCAITNGCSVTVNTDTGFIGIYSPPSISTSPSDSTVCVGNNASFSVSATGASLTYQWQVSTNSGSTWSNISNTGVYSTATTATLNITGATSGMNSYQYRCVVSGSCSPSATSSAATITITPTPSISSHPGSSSVSVNGNTTFTVSANNASSYQWQISTNSGSTWSNLSNGGVYSGVTTSTLSLTTIPLSYNGYQYRCVASGTCNPAANSNAATLTVTGSAPSISSHPQDSTICSGNNASFAVAASGTSLTYQWQVSTNSGSTWSNLANAGIYSGVTTSALLLTSATTTHSSYQYRCVVSGSVSPSATSNAATLTIDSAFTSALGHDYPEICLGSDTSFTAYPTGSSNYTYQWKVSSNYGSSFSNVTNTGFYGGATAQTLSLTSPPVSAHAYYYFCTVTNGCSVSVNTDTGFIAIYSPPSISSHPVNSTIGAGSNTSFSVTASASSIVYQWQVSTNGGSTWSNLSNTGIYSGVTTATLTLTAASAAYNSYQYRCVVSGTCAPTATSNAATLTVNTAPAITAQPTDSTICNGANATFGISATNATAYQWQVSTNGGSSWSNLSNTGIYSGVTTATLTLTAATLSYNNYQYRCEVTGLTTPNAISNGATLTINTAPAISSHPTDSTVCETANASFSVSATGTSLSYQWQENTGSGWGNIANGGGYSNATTAGLTITGASASMSTYQYRCVVTGGCAPAATSNAATLTVNTAPLITAQAAHRTICNGDNTTFSITATGTSLTYQWQVNTGSGWSNVSNAGIYSGATTSTLALTAATTAEDGYQYRCVVSGACSPSETSSARSLTIYTAPVINTQPANTTVCSGGNANFSVAASGNGLTYQWQVNTGSSWSNLSNTGIYSGTTNSTLTLTGATTGSVSGYYYRCIVNGTCSPAVTSDSAELSINSLLSVTTQPTNSTICSGNSTSFTVVASASGLTYQWQVNTGSGWSNVTNTGIYTGATTATLNLATPATSASGNQYRCVLSSSCAAPINSNSATLTVNVAPAITAQPTNSTVCLGSNTSFSVAATGSGIVYQWQVNSGSGWSNVINTGIYSGATTSTLALTAPTASVSTYQYRCVIGGSCVPGVNSDSVMLIVNTPPSINTQPSVSTICSGNNTNFKVSATGTSLTYQWEVNSGSGWANVTNTGIYSGVTSDSLVLTAATTAENGNQYRCVVSGACTPSVTSSSVALTVNSAPALTLQPANSTICEGASTSFGITASGTSLTYQWEVNTGSGWSNVTNTGVYAGATTNTLSLTTPPASMSSYQYRCIVGGTCVPGVNSNTATLTVNTLPTITNQPISSIICSGNNTSFKVSATGTSLAYQWQVNSGSGWSNVANTGIYSGATTDSLVLTAATTAESGYQYRCVVSGTCTPSVTSSVVALTVNSAPALTLQPTNSTICEGASTSFGITATGTSLTYQWEVNSGSGWSNVTNAGVYAGATSNTLSLTTPPASMSSYQYRCIVGGTCVPGVTSNTATLTVNTLPAITGQPTSSVICSGSNTSFKVSAIGTSLAYQWQVNTGSGWGNVTNTGIYSGATTDSLVLTAATTAANGSQYRCVVSGTCTPSVTSSAVALTVNTAPSISTQPLASVICEGANTSFTVSATGTSLAYQWEVNTGSGWSNVVNAGVYAGATTNTLSLTAPAAAMSGYQYRCVIGGVCVPGVTTSAVSLTVNTAPVITSQPVNGVVCFGQDTSFSISATGTSLNYQWEVNSGSGWSNVTNTGVYSGATTSMLSLTTPAASISGYQYRCVVSGTCTPSVTSSTVSITVNTAPSISTQPSNSIICTGGNTSFSISASGTALTYQWQVNSGSGWSNVTNAGIYNGATTNTLSLTAATTVVNSYQYRCLVNGTCNPGVTSNVASLTVNIPPAITASPSDSTICSGDNASFSITATGTSIGYQWQVNSGSGWSNVTNTGVYSGATTNTLSLTAATTTVHGYQYRCLVNGVCPPQATSGVATLTVNALPAITSQPTNSVICEHTNTSFSISATGTGITYQWQVNSGSGWSNVTNTGIYSGVTTNTLSLTAATIAVHNYQYRCVVTGTCSPSVTSNAVSITIQTAPVVTADPVSKIICEGLNHTFSATAVGTALTYQWQVNSGSGWSNITNGGVYSNATTNALTLTSIPPAYTTYQYRCVVSGTCAPNDTTTAATLTVYTNPVITAQPTGNITICSGDSTGYSLSATGTGLTYQWRVFNGSTWSNVTNNSVYSGATTNSLSIDGATAPTTALTYQYYCNITGTCASVNSDTSTLLINARPAIVTQPSAVAVCDSTTNVQFSVVATGTNLSYQWQERVGSTWVNLANGGIYSGATTNQLSMSQVYYSMNGYNYRCIISGTCPPSVTTQQKQLTVHPLKTPAVFLTASNLDICVGTPVTFTPHHINGGSTPSYVWRVNNTNVATGSTFTSSTLADGDTVSCIMTSSYVCPRPATATSAGLGVKVTPYSKPTVTISSPNGNKGCLGRDVKFYTQTTHAGPTPIFTWQVNGQTIGGNTDSFINNTVLNGDVISCIMTSSIKCPKPNPVSSNSVIMDMIKVTKASIQIAAAPDTEICKEQKVTLYTYYTNGGSLPRYQWMVNGKDIVGDTNATLIITNIKDLDTIQCRFMSSARCVFPEVSNPIKFNVDSVRTPVVDVSVYGTGNNSYTFRAITQYGGINPKFQWFKNGRVIPGATDSIYVANDLKRYDKITVELVSSIECVSKKVVMSRNITTGIVENQSAADDLELYPNPNNGSFYITSTSGGVMFNNATIKIVNAVGQKVYERSIKITGSRLKEQVKLNDLAAGMYMLYINTDSKNYMKKFMISK